MTACIIISSITAVLLVLTIIFKPYVKIGRFGLGLYWVIAATPERNMTATNILLSFSSFTDY